MVIPTRQAQARVSRSRAHPNGCAAPNPCQRSASLCPAHPQPCQVRSFLRRFPSSWATRPLDFQDLTAAVPEQRLDSCRAAGPGSRSACGYRLLGPSSSPEALSFSLNRFRTAAIPNSPVFQRAHCHGRTAFTALSVIVGRSRPLPLSSWCSPLLSKQKRPPHCCALGHGPLNLRLGSCSKLAPGAFQFIRCSFAARPIAGAPPADQMSAQGLHDDGRPARSEQPRGASRDSMIIVHHELTFAPQSPV